MGADAALLELRHLGQRGLRLPRRRPARDRPHGRRSPRARASRSARTRATPTCAASAAATITADARRGRGRRALPGGRARRVRARPRRARSRHVKPHGALYNQAADATSLARGDRARRRAREPRAGARRPRRLARRCGAPPRRAACASRPRPSPTAPTTRRTARSPARGRAPSIERPAGRGGAGGAHRPRPRRADDRRRGARGRSRHALPARRQPERARRGTRRARRARSARASSVRPLAPLSFPRARPARRAPPSASSSATRSTPEPNARVRALDRALRAAPLRRLPSRPCPTLRSLLVLYDAGARSVRAAVARAPRARGSAPRRPRRPRRAPPRDPDALRRRGRPRPRGGRRALAGSARARGRRAPRRQRVHGAHARLPPGLRLPRPGCPRRSRARGTRRRASASRPGRWRIAGRQTGDLSRRPRRVAGTSSAARRCALFDPAREPPALIAPGDRVRFVPSRELPAPARAAAPPPAPALGPASRSSASRACSPPCRTRGRAGYRRLGVRLRGRARRARRSPRPTAPSAIARTRAALECTVAGPARCEFLAPVHFAVAGADLGARARARRPRRLAGAARRDACSRGRATCCASRAGATAAVPTSRFAGGIDVPPVLGSRSTDLGVGLRRARRPRAARGRPLALGRAPASRGERRALAAAPHAGSVRVRVVLGPQDDHFAPTTRRALPRGARGASPRPPTASGCRLEGEPLRHHGARRDRSPTAWCPGSIQVPPDGQPIVMLADGPTTGGYPKIATVLAVGLAAPGAAAARRRRGPVRVGATPGPLVGRGLKTLQDRPRECDERRGASLP